MNGWTPCALGALAPNLPEDLMAGSDLSMDLGRKDMWVESPEPWVLGLGGTTHWLVDAGPVTCPL